MSLRSLRLSLTLSLLVLATPGWAWDGSLAASYVRTFAPSDPFMNLGLSLTHAPRQAISLSLGQELRKNFLIDSTTAEWEFSDTRLGANFTPKSWAEDWSWSWGLSTTLPVSKNSRALGVHTKPEARIAVRFAASDWLQISGSSFARYYINEFESGPAEGEEGGIALPEYGLGLSHAMTATFGGFSFGYSYNYRETSYHDIAPSPGEQAFIDKRPTQGYSLGAFVGLDLWPKASISLGFDQGSSLVQPGWEDYVLFDEQESSWNLSFSQGL